MDAAAIDTSDLDLVDDVLKRAATVNGEIEAYVEPATPERSRSSISFAEWNERSDAFAAELARRGVRRHDVVCLLMGPSIDYAIAYQAIMRCGAVASGINPRLARQEQESIFERMRPIVTVAEDELAANATAFWGDVMTKSQIREVPLAPFAPNVDRSPSDYVAVVWTSGTTGLPKGALFDHTSLKAVAAGTDLLSFVGDRKLSPLPFAHVGYMTRQWDEISNGITTIITPTPWRASAALETIIAERVTLAQGVPTQWSLILELAPPRPEDISSVRIVTTGAARMAPSQVAALRERFGVPVVVRYTSTETSLGTGTRLDDDDATVATTVGRPVASVEMALVDEVGHEVAHGEVGRVRLRSGAVMKGYVGPRQDGARDEPLRVDSAATDGVLSNDGWITTGDFGVLDAAGNLSLVGRDNELYQRGGYNIYPAEVEQAIDGAPGVAAVAVVAGADDVLGEIGIAFVVPDPDVEAPTRDSIRAHLAERVADYKVPDVVVLVDDLPVTAMGKIDKKVLKVRANEVAKERSDAVAATRRK